MEDFQVGNIVKAEVTGIETYGIFVKIGEYDGLIHISEIANRFVSDVSRYVKIGENIFAQIIEVDNNNKKIKLSIKGLNYKEFYPNRKVKESVRGFLPLQQNLEKWTKDTLEQINTK